MYFLELWYGSVALHGEGLPGAGLSVGEDCPVVTLGLLLYNKHTDRPTGGDCQVVAQENKLCKMMTNRHTDRPTTGGDCQVVTQGNKLCKMMSNKHSDRPTVGRTCQVVTLKK